MPSSLFFWDQWLFGHHSFPSPQLQANFCPKNLQIQGASNTLLNLSASFKAPLILLGFPWIGRCIHRQPLRIVWPYRACGRGLVALPQVKARSNNNQHLYRFFNDQLQKKKRISNTTFGTVDSVQLRLFETSDLLKSIGPWLMRETPMTSWQVKLTSFFGETHVAEGEKHKSAAFLGGFQWFLRIQIVDLKRQKTGNSHYFGMQHFTKHTSWGFHWHPRKSSFVRGLGVSSGWRSLPRVKQGVIRPVCIEDRLLEASFGSILVLNFWLFSMVP